MSRQLREPVAVACGSSQGVAHSAGGQYNAAGTEDGAVGAADAAGRAILDDKRVDTTVVANVDIGHFFQSCDKSQEDVERFAAFGIYTLAAFDDERDAVDFEELHEVGVEELRE